MRVLGFGTYDISAHPRVGVVLDGLREHGDEVVEINEPLGFSTAQRVEMLQRPWLVGSLALRLLACWGRLTRQALRARRVDSFDAVVVGYLGHFDVLLARLLFRRATIVLDMLVFAADTARDRGVTGGLRLLLLDRLDRLALRCADLVMVDTDDHLALLPPDRRSDGVAVPVGAATEWFAVRRPAGPGSGTGPLRVVFYGLFTPLQGAVTIGESLARLADRSDITVTMIGSGQDLEAARAAATTNPYVTWHSWVSATDLPAVVAEHDVCLGIFGDTPKAHRVVPNKVYQGAAAGCAIVTSDTGPQRHLLGSAAVLVDPSSPVALAEALVGLAEDRLTVARLGAAAASLADARFIPSAIVDALRARLAE